MGAQDVGDAEWNPALGMSDTWGGTPRANSGRTHRTDGSPFEREGDLTESSAASPEEGPDVHAMDGTSPQIPRLYRG